MTSNNHRYRDAYRAAFVGLGVNFALGLTKLAVGVLARSGALVADAVNSLGDALTSIAVLYGLNVAQRPADEEHPYGHSRAEGIAATNVAVAIIVSGAIVAWESLQRMGKAPPTTDWWILAIAAGNVLLKEGLFRYNIRISRRTGSASILANAWDHRNDAFCSLAVLFSLGIIRWGGPEYAWIDPLAALMVSTIIILSGIHLFRGSARDLMDIQADSSLVAAIRQAAEKVEGVQEIETLLVRKSGLEYLVDMHIEVRAELTVEQGHRISHLVKDRLLQEFHEVRNVLVHIEPYPHRHDPQPAGPTPPQA
ncbi:MAG: cation diffusion facilitator family transporter [Planctomycetaceae bacterium]|nr:cation transporter [Planctomycetaceae bacterium]